MTDNPQALWYLEGIHLFSRFCPIKSKESSALTAPKRYRAGESIYLEGDPAEYMYIVLSGRVRIGYHLENGHEVTKSILSEGEAFGEMGLVGVSRRCDFAESMDADTALCLIHNQEVSRLMHSDADMSLRLLKWIGLRLVKLERKIELLTFKDARTRVVEFLKDAASYKGKPIGTETLIRTRLTHDDIGKLTATSRQTVSEVLNQLRSEDQIYYERGRILIRDVKSLK